MITAKDIILKRIETDKGRNIEKIRASIILNSEYTMSLTILEEQKRELIIKEIVTGLIRDFHERIYKEIIDELYILYKMTSSTPYYTHGVINDPSTFHLPSEINKQVDKILKMISFNEFMSPS